MTMLEGLVEATNERGIKVKGEWLNKSQFRPLTLPDVGAAVRVRTDVKGFIQSLEVLDDDDKAVEIVLPEPTAMRLTVLNAAAIFGASRGDLKSADVLKIADLWLAWVEGSPRSGVDR